MPLHIQALVDVPEQGSVETLNPCFPCACSHMNWNSEDFFFLTISRGEQRHGGCKSQQVSPFHTACPPLVQGLILNWNFNMAKCNAMTETSGTTQSSIRPDTRSNYTCLSFTHPSDKHGATSWRLLPHLVGAAQARANPQPTGTDNALHWSNGSLQQPSVRCTLFNWFDGIFWTANHHN